jgi:cytochrome c oxidase subunit 3
MSEAHDHHEHDDHGHGHGHGSRFIQHHYDDASHQFDAGKLGIWAFLVQEVLFFSALFVCYILYRTNHPEIYEYAHHYLQVKWGAINTGVLILSSLTAAWAVRCAQLNQRKGLIFCLTITILCACGFLGIKYVEYAHKIEMGELYGSKFDPCDTPNETPLITRSKLCAGTKSSVVWNRDTNKPDAGCLGSKAFRLNATTHEIEAKCTVDEVKFAVSGDKKTEVGRRTLDACEMETEASGERKPKHFPCYLLQLNGNVCATGPGALALYGDDAKRGDDIGLDVACVDLPALASKDDPFVTPASSTTVGAKQIAPIHQMTDAEEVEELESSPPPPKTNMFFSIYFAMTGLHGIHVLLGIFVFLWLLIRAIKGHFTPDYFGPVDYAALYWHLVDLIWIFLFPLMYLIH